MYQYRPCNMYLYIVPVHSTYSVKRCRPISEPVTHPWLPADVRDRGEFWWGERCVHVEHKNHIQASVRLRCMLTSGRPRVESARFQLLESKVLSNFLLSTANMHPYTLVSTKTYFVHVSNLCWADEVRKWWQGLVSNAPGGASALV